MIGYGYIYGGRYVSSAPAFDADAQAFITAASITDATQKNAINQLVLDLKSYSLWSKMKAIYPMVGGTATAHKWNLKDPRDLDAAFRLVFAGGWTHSSTGALPNGTTAYADTFLNPSVDLGLTNASYSFYSRTNIGTVAFPISFGAYQSSNQSFYSFIRTSGNLYVQETFNQSQRIFVALSDSRGFFVGSRTSATSLKAFRNNSFLGQNLTTQSGASLPSISVYLSARNDLGTAASYDKKECSFFHLGDGLDDTESANLYTAVQAFQTTLSRNV